MRQATWASAAKTFSNILLFIALVVTAAGVVMTWKQNRANKAADNQAQQAQQATNHDHNRASTPSANTS